MSILIHGMKMPKERECVVIFSDGKAGKYPAAALYGYDGKDARCAIELPPHGRLGDLDALIDVIERIDWYHQAPNKEMVHGANSEEHQAWYKEQDVYRAIEGASTIIPADPEEGGRGNV